MIRKLVRVGTSRAVVVPHEWIRYYELQGIEIKEVSVEVNDKLIITPIIPKKESINESTPE